MLTLITARPDDDAPRRVWADMVGGERGELVQLQCELAALEGTLEQRVARLYRERQLLLSQGVALSGLEGLAERFLFRRGFVEWAAVDAAVLLARGEELFEAAPLLNSLRIDGLTLDRGDPVELAARVISHPILKRVQNLSLGSVALTTETDRDDSPDYEYYFEETTALLAKSGLRLRAVETGGLDAKGLRALLDAGVLVDVESLVDPALELVADGAFPHLSLLVASGARTKGVLRGLPATLRELRLSGIDDETLEHLASSPAAPAVRRLKLHHGSLPRDASALKAFTSLRSLDLGDMRFGVAGYAQSATDALATFTRLELPTLKELRLPGLTLEQLRSVARAFGRHLELFDLRGQNLGLRDTVKAAQAELAALVAGEVWFGAWDQPIHPFQRPRSDGESWIGSTTLPWHRPLNWRPDEV